MGLSEFLYQHFALLVEDIDEILENLEVESRREHLASNVPFRSGARQKAGVEPRVQVLVLARFIDELATAEQTLGKGKLAS